MIERLTHNEEVLHVSESAEISWFNMLAEFDENIWPIFAKRGYTKDTALQVWWLNRIESQLIDLLERTDS